MDEEEREGAGRGVRTGMKTREPKRYKVIMNPELEQALKGYKIEFGNRDDMMIVRRLGKLKQDLAKVDNEVLRGTKKGEGKMNSTMSGILSAERRLIAEITRRNLDF